ncbi:MAG: hypothetical protein HONBIEJF_01586 [Fimbriimonadaceae bacterium]|nr:hypothetical protein [Fimbriimonadaceae bacterium]
MSVLEQTAAFLLTDLVGSTRLHQDYPGEMVVALQRHAEIVSRAVAAQNGELFKRRGEGDSTFSVFATAQDAVNAAVAIQRGLKSVEVAPQVPLRARIGIHFGTALLFDSDYQGAVVNLCARIRSVAHGGQILISEAARQLLSGTEVKDLGYVRLADVHERQHVFQVCADGLESEFPGLRSLELGGLPRPVTPFVGRVSETADLIELVRGHVLVTVTGLGGIGKTRIAIEVASRLAPQFPHGVHFARVEVGVNESDLASTLFAEISKDRPDRPIQALAAVMNREPHLIVLDNAEVALPSVKSLLKEAASHDGAGRWIVTSREVLNLPGEASFAIGPMGLPDGTVAGDAVALLMEGIRRVAPRASVSNEDLAEICREANGIPLCLDLIAPHFRSLSSHQILQRFESLINRDRDEMGPRHSSIQAALESSFQVLSAVQRDVFSRIAIFAGSFSPEAAEAVAAFGAVERGQVLPALQELVDGSLLNVDLETGRFRLLDLVRHFGMRTEGFAEARDGLWDRLQGWLETHIADHCGRLSGPEGSFHTASIASEIDNIRCLLDARFAAGKVPVQLLADMAMWWYRENPHQGWKYLQQAAVAMDEVITESSCVLLNRAGVVGYALSHPREGRDLLERALQQAEQLGDESRANSILANIALTYLQEGRPIEALPLLERAIAFYKGSGDASTSIRVAVNLGRALLEMEDHERAATVLTSAAHDAVGSGLVETAALASLNLGLISLLKWPAEPERAIAYFLECMEEPGRLSLANRAYAAIGLALALNRRGTSQLAMQLIQYAEQVRAENGIPPMPHESRHFGDELSILRGRLENVHDLTVRPTLTDVLDAVRLQGIAS